MQLRLAAACAAALGLLLGSGAVLAPAALAQTVGTTSAVNPASSGGGKTLILGESVVHNERISTDSKGSVQLLFIDRTTMSIGPDSDIVIDDYLYDPSKGVGKMAVTVGKGLMRFVGGQVTHSGEATVKTSSAVIGIRGGTAQISVDSKGTQAVFLGGNSPGAGLILTPTAAPAAAQNISTPGFGSTVASGGASATPPAPVPPAVIQALNVAIAATSAAAGGGAPAGTAQAIAAIASSTAGAVASNVITTVTNAVGNGASAASTAAAAVQQASTISGIAASTINTAIQTVLQTTTATSAQATAETVIQQAQAVIQQLQLQQATFALNMTNCCDPNNQTSPVPYLSPSFFPAGFNFSSSGGITPLVGFRTASTDTPNPALTIQYGFNISGLGASQRSWFLVETGAFKNDGNGGLVYSAGFVGTAREAANQTIGRDSGAVSSPPGAVTADLQLLPVSAALNQNNFNPQTGTYTQQPATFFLGGGAGSTNYDFTQTASQTSVPAGFGVNRPAATLSGFAAGLMQTINGVGSANPSVAAPPFIVANASASPNDVSMVLDPITGRMQAAFNLIRQSGTAANSFSTAQYQFGSLTDARSRGLYLDYDVFAARDAVVTDSQGNTPPASIVNGTAVNTHAAALLNVRTADAQAVASSLSTSAITWCQCDFTRWGFWSTDSTRIVNGTNVADRGNLLLWVAGRSPQISDVPTTGTATYAGHAIANIANGSGNVPNQYLAAGNFSNVVNFATRSGNVSITGLDATNYSGTMAINPNDPRTFVGALTNNPANPANPGNRNIALSGSFFAGAASPVGEMGGQINITGPNYLGAGIFAARH